MGENLRQNIPTILVSGLFSIMCVLLAFNLNQDAVANNSVNEEIEVLKVTKLDKTDFSSYKQEHIIYHEQEQKYVDQIKLHFDDKFEDLKQYIDAVSK